MAQTQVFGRTVRYECRGEERDRSTVALFLHGWGASGGLFGRMLDVVGERYFVLAPDLPGFGGSEEPSEPWDVDGFVRFVLTFLEPFAPKKAVLFGHSFGGRICLKLGARTDLPFSVEKMVLFDAAGILPKRGLSYRCKVGTYKLGKRFLSLPPVRKLFPDALERFRSGKGSSDYAAASPVMKACLVKAVNEDLSPLLPKIAPSTLLIWGENDTATPLSDGLRMEKEIPDAGLVRLPGVGHFSFAEDPYTCERVVRSFLQIGEGGRR